jgi:hypothetical protein
MSLSPGFACANDLQESLEPLTFVDRIVASGTIHG